MEKITPYKQVNDALLSLDNGGRFYNLQTKADDGIISQAELGKVGGIFGNKQKMILFLELSISKLNSNEQEIVISKLDEKLKADYFKYKPQNLLPSEVTEKGIVASNVILTGIPRLIEAKSDFMGFIMVPMLIGQVTTFTLIPLIDEYDVYELRDEESSETFIIAHSKNSKKLPHKKTVIAGVLKELETEQNENGTKKPFLEVFYHIVD